MIWTAVFSRPHVVSSFQVPVPVWNPGVEPEEAGNSALEVVGRSSGIEQYALAAVRIVAAFEPAAFDWPAAFELECMLVAVESAPAEPTQHSEIAGHVGQHVAAE
jgi:hypothetical protein